MGGLLHHTKEVVNTYSPSNSVRKPHIIYVSDGISPVSNSKSGFIWVGNALKLNLYIKFRNV